MCDDPCYDAGGHATDPQTHHMWTIRAEAVLITNFCWLRILLAHAHVNYKCLHLNFDHNNYKRLSEPRPSICRRLWNWEHTGGYPALSAALSRLSHCAAGRHESRRDREGRVPYQESARVSPSDSAVAEAVVRLVWLSPRVSAGCSLREDRVLPERRGRWEVEESKRWGIYTSHTNSMYNYSLVHFVFRV